MNSFKFTSGKTYALVAILAAASASRLTLLLLDLTL